MDSSCEYAPSLVLLATAWGPKHGGINAFNVELARSLAILPERNFNLFCVVPLATEEEIADAHRDRVRLVSLDAATPSDGTFGVDRAAAIVDRINAAECLLDRIVWIGHDDKTGFLAIALRDACTGSKALLVHHMAARAYQGHKKNGAKGADKKQKEQKELFGQADLCMAVGPMLRDHLHDLLKAGVIPIEMMIPGLAEPDVAQARARHQSPNNFVAFVSGRLGEDDERIKQPLLSVCGFGAAVKRAFSSGNEQHSIRKSPALHMRGVSESQKDSITAAFSNAANRVITFKLDEYTEDRKLYFDELAESSVAVMPSWHEGFGLTAWEAIAYNLPTVLGEQSGVYRLLTDPGLKLGKCSSVEFVAVRGRLPKNKNDKGPPHTADDVVDVGNALYKLSDDLESSREAAETLSKTLRHDHGFTWARCARDLVAAADRNLQFGLALPVSSQQALTAPKVQSAEQSDIPFFLRPPQPRLWCADLGQAPSALLIARDRVVRFQPERDPLVNGWLAEINDPSSTRLNLRLINGEGGTGKTRSALELLSRANHPDKHGWTGLWLPAKLPADAVEQWRELVKASPGRYILVIDYAEGRQGDLLAWLQVVYDVLRTGAVGGGQLRVHLFCLARNAAWWEQLSRHPDCSEDIKNLLFGPANLGVAAMPPLDANADERTLAYRHALEDYASAQGLPVPANAWQPKLEGVPYERPLYIHLAALAALAGERPAHAQSLLRTQIDREFQYWRKTSAKDGSAPVTYMDWADVTAWVALSQGAPFSALRPAMSALQIESPGLATALSQTTSASLDDLPPLQPDLLAEHLIVEQLSGRRGAVISRLALEGQTATAEQALEVIGRLSTRPDADPIVEGETLPIWVGRVTEALALAWPAHGNLLIFAAHEFGENLGRWVTDAWRSLDADAKSNLVDALELPGFSTPLYELSAEVAEIRLGLAVSCEEMAAALDQVNIRFSRLGGKEATKHARDAAEQAVKIWQFLAVLNPPMHLSSFAFSLNRWASHLTNNRDPQSQGEAVNLSRKALRMHQNLDPQSGKYSPRIASSMGSLAGLLAALGDPVSRREALELGLQGVDIYRRLEQQSDNQGTYAHVLAGSLNNLSKDWMDGPRYEGQPNALCFAIEGLAVCRPHAEAKPAEFSVLMATLLHTVGIWLCERKDQTSRAQGVAAARTGNNLFRRLVYFQGKRHWPELANSLNTLASHMSECDSTRYRDEALALMQEAVALYRKLYAEEKLIYKFELAMSLNNLSNRLNEQADLGSRNAALRCAHESADLCCELAKELPYTHCRDLALSLYTLAGRLAEQGCSAAHPSALHVARRSVMAYLWVCEYVSKNLADELEDAKGRFQAIADECGLHSHHELQRVAAEFHNADPYKLLSELCEPLER